MVFCNCSIIQNFANQTFGRFKFSVRGPGRGSSNAGWSDYARTSFTVNTHAYSRVYCSLIVGHLSRSRVVAAHGVTWASACLFDAFVRIYKVNPHSQGRDLSIVVVVVIADEWVVSRTTYRSFSVFGELRKPYAVT